MPGPCYFEALARLLLRWMQGFGAGADGPGSVDGRWLQVRSANMVRHEEPTEEAPDLECGSRTEGGLGQSIDDFECYDRLASFHPETPVLLFAGLRSACF